MLHLYVIRHGETEWNVEKRSQGRLDSELTDKGKNDARALGKRLKDIEFQHIITSPSKRTMETAKLVKGDRPIALTTDDRLLEINLGAWQGKTEDEIRMAFPEEYHLYWNQPEAYTSQEGESFLEVQLRTETFLNELEQNFTEGNVLVVTHGVVIKTLYLICRGASIHEIWHPPFIHGTSLTTVNISDGKRELLLEGCSAHCT
ncbi:MAG TPA: histidine phosphatase family protein [Bacillus bacterium]|nr:histidine phosphatase family protein [Bacillus sp. (in: firmicutes)]